MDAVFCGELGDVGDLVIGYRLHGTKTVVTELHGHSNDVLFLFIQFFECSCDDPLPLITQEHLLQRLWACLTEDIDTQKGFYGCTLCFPCAAFH